MLILQNFMLANGGRHTSKDCQQILQELRSCAPFTLLGKQLLFTTCLIGGDYSHA